MLLMLALGSVLEQATADPSWIDTHPHTWELEPLKRWTPRVPKAEASALLHGTCHVRVLVDTGGQVERVFLEQPTHDCPDALGRATLLGVSRWTFEPHRPRGVAKPASAVLHFDWRPGSHQADWIPDMAWGPAHVRSELDPEPVGLGGRCIVHVRVTEAGTAESVQVLDCPDEVRASAVRAATDARYWPQVLEGQVAAGETQVVVRVPAR